MQNQMINQPSFTHINLHETRSNSTVIIESSTSIVGGAYETRFRFANDLRGRIHNMRTCHQLEGKMFTTSLEACKFKPKAKGIV